MSSKQPDDFRQPFRTDGERQRRRSRDWRFLRSIRRLASSLLNWDRTQETVEGPQQSPPEPIWLTLPGVIGCPVCGALYMAETNAAEDEAELEDQELEAMNDLAEECPDHSSYLLVGI